ncbi:hypothetical protein GGR56DRAFT_8397 [Xylariaceae sp. FL0804]|nr:hypothetical protein GGR56DRAFT_8397 [Xylariaceae sp. FL0804]
MANDMQKHDDSSTRAVQYLSSSSSSQGAAAVTLGVPSDPGYGLRRFLLHDDDGRDLPLPLRTPLAEDRARRRMAAIIAAATAKAAAAEAEADAEATEATPHGGT